MTSSPASESDAPTASAASNVQPPTNTERRRQQRLLVPVQQVVAPGDRSEQRLSARYQVTRLLCQEPKWGLLWTRQVSSDGQATQERAWREQLDPRGRQLDASGRPSSRAQISTTAVASSSPSTRLGATARARSTNNWPAGAAATAATEEVTSSTGSSTAVLRVRAPTASAAARGWWQAL